MELPSPITTIEQWEAAYAATATEPLLIFKHSTQCSISSGAHDELSNWLEDATNLNFKVIMVLVPENRPVSNAISEQLGVKHESPQLLFVQNGSVSWHASHWRITYSTLDEHLGTHCEK